MARVIAAALALAAGLAIMWMDTRPTWDDTGITAAALALVALVAALAGLRPWLAATLVAAPVVLAELPKGYGVLLAIPFAVAGAVGGWLLRRRPAAR